jgi:hypothetical protein
MCGDILIDGFDFDTKDPSFRLFSLGNLGAAGRRRRIHAGEKAPATADLSLSNVVSVAKNDQLYNPINLNRKEKGTYERIR